MRVTRSALLAGATPLAADAGEFIALAERAKPLWLVAALLLQAGTYIAQGEVWRRTCATAKTTLPVRDALVLSLAKLFADQALPSGGVSGSVVVSHALDQRGLEPRIGRAGHLVRNRRLLATTTTCELGIVPGGLGTFEATSVLTLAATGVSLATALSATLLFRGLSFWLPMAPGVWASRSAMTSSRATVTMEGPY
jgi:uncharacterized membrane protein YbhN (UPF0104 family)